MFPYITPPRIRFLRGTLKDYPLFKNTARRNSSHAKENTTMTKLNAAENTTFWKSHPFNKTPEEIYYDFLYPDYHPVRITSRPLWDCVKMISNPNSKKYKRAPKTEDFVSTKSRPLKKKKRVKMKGNSLQKLRNKRNEKKRLDAFSRFGKVKKTRKKWSAVENSENRCLSTPPNDFLKLNLRGGWNFWKTFGH